MLLIYMWMYIYKHLIGTNFLSAQGFHPDWAEVASPLITCLTLLEEPFWSSSWSLNRKLRCLGFDKFKDILERTSSLNFFKLNVFFVCFFFNIFWPSIDESKKYIYSKPNIAKSFIPIMTVAKKSYNHSADKYDSVAWIWANANTEYALAITVVSMLDHNSGPAAC